MLITFSGLDGAGKSTLIARLRSDLERTGRSVQVLTIYDHVGLYPAIRLIRDRLMGGRGTDIMSASTDPDRLGTRVPRRSGPLGLALAVLRSRFMKRCVLLIDLTVLAAFRAWIELLNRRVLILDRYVYDSLADVLDGRRWGFASLVLKLAPVPDLPVFIDVPPEIAFKRKGEYTVEYMRARRAVYRRIFAGVEESVTLENSDLAACAERLLAHARQRLERKT